MTAIYLSVETLLHRAANLYNIYEVVYLPQSRLYTSL